jgi:hypothetical protein
MEYQFRQDSLTVIPSWLLVGDIEVQLAAALEAAGQGAAYCRIDGTRVVQLMYENAQPVYVRIGTTSATITAHDIAHNLDTNDVRTTTTETYFPRASWKARVFLEAAAPAAHAA